MPRVREYRNKNIHACIPSRKKNTQTTINYSFSFPPPPFDWERLRAAVEKQTLKLETYLGKMTGSN